jgi:hypothetical protein
MSIGYNRCIGAQNSTTSIYVSPIALSLALTLAFLVSFFVSNPLS